MSVKKQGQRQFSTAGPLGVCAPRKSKRRHLGSLLKKFVPIRPRFLAAADLGQFVYNKEPAGISSPVRAIEALVTILDCERETVEARIFAEVSELEPSATPEMTATCISYVRKLLSNPDESVEFLGLVDLQRHFNGLAVKRESSIVASPLHQIMARVERDGSLAISRRIVCYYCKRPEYEECKDWLCSLIARDIPNRPTSITENRPVASFIVNRTITAKPRIGSVTLRKQAEALLKHSGRKALSFLKPSTTVQTYAPPMRDDHAAAEAWDADQFADDIDPAWGGGRKRLPQYQKDWQEVAVPNLNGSLMAGSSSLPSLFILPLSPVDLVSIRRDAWWSHGDSNPRPPQCH